MGGHARSCWDDTTQAVAYAHTLLAFLEAFPEFKETELYLAGESYFGQVSEPVHRKVARRCRADAEAERADRGR